MSDSEWSATEIIKEINGNMRPEVTKNIWAVATAKFACEYFKWDIDKIDKWKIAPYINAIGGIHGKSAIDIPGDRYAQTALKMLRGIGDSHLAPPEKWFPKNNDKIAQCKPFLDEVFKILGSTPAHSPTSPANKRLKSNLSKIIKANKKNDSSIVIHREKGEHLNDFPDLFLKILECKSIEDCNTQFSEKNPGFLPQPGFIGFRYSKKRILFLAQNPGYASASVHFPGEDKMWQLFQQFQNSHSQSDYEDIMEHLYNFMRTWPIIQKLKLKERFNLELQDIAYFNVLKCKCNKGENISKNFYRHCLNTTTQVQLEFLKPKVIICLGKAPYELLQDTEWHDSATWIVHPSGGEWRQPSEKVQKRICLAQELIKRKI